MGSTMKPKVAFVTGGNGITGSAIIEHLAANTSTEEWSQIIVTSRSPFQTLVSDPRIKFIALDFTKDAETLATEMRENCHGVTHAFFSSYVHKDSFKELNSANQALFENFLLALVKVAPDLANVALQTGGKYYNVSSLCEQSYWSGSLFGYCCDLSMVADHPLYRYTSVLCRPQLPKTLQDS